MMKLKYLYVAMLSFVLSIFSVVPGWSREVEEATAGNSVYGIKPFAVIIAAAFFLFFLRTLVRNNAMK